MPEKVTVSYKGQTVESKVAWDKSSYQVIGRTTVTGKLIDCRNAEISTEMLVCPKNAVYFANASKAPVSADYTSIMKQLGNTLLHTVDVYDGAYSTETGFGYVEQKESCVTAQMTFIKVCVMQQTRPRASVIGLIWKPENIMFMWVCLTPPAGGMENAMRISV